MKKRSLARVLGVSAVLCLPCTISLADLIHDSRPGGQWWHSLDALFALLKIDSKGSTATGPGSVSYSRGPDVKTNTGVLASGGKSTVGDVKTGTLHAAESGGNPVTLHGPQMSVFDHKTDMFDAHLGASGPFDTMFTRIGNEGFVSKLDAAQAAALQTLLNGLIPATVAGPGIGLSASASNGGGRPEAFNLATTSTNVAPLAAVPEPGTLLFVGTALGGLSLAAWRGRSSALSPERSRREEFSQSKKRVRPCNLLHNAAKDLRNCS